MNNNDNDNNNNLGHLPTELVSLIVPYLSQRNLYQCTLINKRFYTLTNPLLWASPHICRHNQQLFTTSLSASPHLGQHVHALRTNQVNLCTTLMRWMACFSPQQLTSLTIDIAHTLTNDLLISFLYLHPQLETLVLKNLPRTIDVESFQALGQYCHQLHHLTLAPYYDPTASIFSALAAGCPLVKSLDIDFYHDRDGRLLLSACFLHQFRGLHLESHVLALARLRHLEHLRLQYPNHEFEKLMLTTLTTTTTMTMTTSKDRTIGFGEEEEEEEEEEKALPQLTRLELGLLTPINDRHAIALIQSHPRLQHFSLDFSLITSTTNTTSELTDRFLDAIPTWLPDLKTLELRVTVRDRGSITSVGLRQLVQQCRSLTHVSFPHLHHIKLNDFPEVKRGWLQDGYPKVNELNQETIHRIRLGTEQQQQQQ